MHRIRIGLVGGLASLAMMVAAAGAASASTNNQSGLVNVNVSGVTAQVPVSVAVPVSLAANVCGVSVNVLANQLQNSPVSCTATSYSTALNTAVANAMTQQGGGGASNHQSGLVNVNLSQVAIQVPASVSVPIGVAANVCGVDANVLATQAQGGSASCTATSTSQALSNAIASAIV